MKLCKLSEKREWKSVLKNGSKEAFQKMEYQVGDMVKLKKEHPCGSKVWQITRIGVDFKLKCQGCGHEIMVDRPKALKMIKEKI